MQRLTPYKYRFVENFYINVSTTKMAWHISATNESSAMPALEVSQMKCSKHTLLNSPAQSLDQTEAIPSMISISAEGIDRYDIHT